MLETIAIGNHSGGGKNERTSNFELYRIICMLMIVAHHYVVNSGLTAPDSSMMANPDSINSLYLWIFGMWGKTGINCFLLITGYFMCKSNISIRKFIKLMLWIYLYKIIFFCIFVAMGYEHISIGRLIKLAMPVWGFNTNFTSCFIGFWLTIPFWNILIKNMTKRQHQLLLILLLGMYSLCGSLPTFSVAMNYVTWFGIIYLIASYIRLYPNPMMCNKRLWGWISILTIVISCLVAIGMQIMFNAAFYFMQDSNKFFAVIFAISSFLFFKNLNLSYSKLINAIGGSTFGVLLIHANSDAMRQWLWKDTVDCLGHYNLPFIQLILFTIGVVVSIFFICILIDRVRIRVVETPFFRWYDKKPRFTSLLSILE